MKNSRLKKGVVLGMLAFLFTVTFQAQPSEKQQRREKPPTFSELLEKMDANDDGKLSEKEVKGPLKKQFAKVDADEDGFITEEELKKAPKPKRRERSRNK